MRHLDIERNELLRRLPEASLARIAPALDVVGLAFRDVLQEPGRAVEHVYFPTSGLVSLVTPAGDHDVIETGTVGRDGVVGLAAILGNATATSRALCQIPGTALRVPAAALVAAAHEDAALRNVLLGYANVLFAMVAQCAACNLVHDVEARMARWLLMCRDRVDSAELPLTQDLLGCMLGVRRPTVSLAGTALQNAGLIRYVRGRITILDPDGLRAVACDCYDLIRSSAAASQATVH